MMTKQTQEALKMAVEHIEHNGATTERKMVLQACNSSQPQDWMNAALLAQQARNTHPAPVWQGLSDCASRFSWICPCY